jgi:hypothetical protein
MKYFLEHINENIEEKETFLFLSDNLREILKSIDSNISNKLLELEKNKIKYDHSYIDVSKKEGMLSILSINRLGRVDGVSEEDLINPSSDSPVWDNRHRIDIRIGAVVKKFLPDVMAFSELEGFVNSIKSKTNVNKYTLKVVNGEDIRKWYNVNNYYNPTPNVVDRDDVCENENDPRTTLMRSCLKQVEKQPFFDIYTKNEGQVGMLIMLNEQNKLLARAIVWFGCFIADNIEKPTVGTLMDRIYYTNDSDVNIFIDYAKKNNWWFKPQQSKEIYSFVVDGKTTNKSVTIRLKNHGNYDKYPYLDTLCYYTPETGRLSSTRGVPKPNIDRYQLHSTSGGKKKLSPNK